MKSCAFRASPTSHYRITFKWRIYKNRRVHSHRPSSVALVQPEDAFALAAEICASREGRAEIRQRVHSFHVVAQIMARGESFLAEWTGGEASVELHVVPQALWPVEALATLGTRGSRRRRRRSGGTATSWNRSHGVSGPIQRPERREATAYAAPADRWNTLMLICNYRQLIEIVSYFS